MIALALVMTSALLAGDIPLAQRVEKLTPFFKPAPGEALAFNEAELRDLSKKIAPGKLRGQIVVTPPNGTCLTIQRNVKESDDVVCKKTTLTFRYNELDKNGLLNWKISTGEGDFGTPLTWHTPYRVAIVTPFDKSLDDPPEYRYVKQCTAINDPKKGRRIVLTMVDGEAWVVRFPAKDQLLLQPDPLPNLYMNQTQGRISVKDAAENNKHKDEAKGEHGGAKPEGEHGEAPPQEPTAPKVPSEEEERASWSIPRRGTYTMPASNFQPFGSVAGGMNGECRYIDKGPAEDPSTGRLECHDVDGFKQVYIPLTCLGQVTHSR